MTRVKRKRDDTNNEFNTKVEKKVADGYTNTERKNYASRWQAVRSTSGLFKCVNSERDLFYMDNTRQVRGCCQGTLKRGGIVVEQIGRSSGSYYS